MNKELIRELKHHDKRQRMKPDKIEVYTYYLTMGLITIFIFCIIILVITFLISMFRG